MNKLLVALLVLAIVGLAGAAQAECIWSGTYWDCGGRYIYPKFYPHDTEIINGQYTHPPMPSPEDLSDVPSSPTR
jgi:hypothetical protein